MKFSLIRLAVLSLFPGTLFADTETGTPSFTLKDDLIEVHESALRRFVADGRDGHRSIHPGQRSEIKFDETGFTLHPFAKADGEKPSWTWGLELTALNGRAASASAPRTEGEKLVVSRSEQVAEWFVNHAHGLEQGWTLSAPLDETGLVRLELGVRGGLEPSVSSGSVAFSDGDSLPLLTYAGLKSWDATGRPLDSRFVEGGSGAFTIEVDVKGAAYPVTIDPTVQNAYLKHSHSDQEDFYGRAIAIDGNTAVVGAYIEASAATTINGDASDNTAPQRGAAFVYVRSGNTWSQQAYLKASVTTARFGSSVAISGDTIVVGAANDSTAAGVAGGAYVFVRSGNTWTEQAFLSADNADIADFFGGSGIAIDGDTIAVGADSEDSIATGVSATGSADNSVDRSGAVYVFTRNAGVWTQQAYLKASNNAVEQFFVGDTFGESVSLSGDTLVVGASEEDSNGQGVNAPQNNELGGRSGAAYVFVRNAGVWTQQAYLKSSNSEAGDRFGRSVSISGDRIVVGAVSEASNASGVNGDQNNNLSANSGAAYVFVRADNVWTQEAYLKATPNGSGHQFGYHVAISGDLLLVGAPFESSSLGGVDPSPANGNLTNAGAAYVFSRSGGNWGQVNYLKASTPGEEDQFGSVIAISGTTALFGVPEEDSNANGIGGDETDNSAPRAGAAYLFDLDGSLVPPGPAILTTQSPRPFPKTAVRRSSKPQILSLSNTGESPLTGLRLTLSGKAAKDFRITPPGVTTLTAGGSTSYQITFKPRKKGNRSASLTVGSSVGSRVLGLTGKGK